MKITRVLILCVILVTALACVKIDLDELPSSQKGQIELTTDWSQLRPGITIPSNYNVGIDDTIFNFTEQINILPAMRADKYKLYIYNNPKDISVNNHIATTTVVDGIISNMPEYLFTSTIDVVVEDDLTKRYTAVMQQQIFDLTMELTIEGGDTNKIQSIFSQLDGMASQFNIETNELGGNGSIQPIFTLVGTTLISKFRTFGTADQPQIFILKITYNDGHTQIVESDLSSLLVDFNKMNEAVLSLKGFILNTPTEVGNIDGTVINWETKTGSVIVN